MNRTITNEQMNFTKADLEAVNNARALTLVPAMIVLGILMVVGILGNSLVCYIFCCRLQSGTQNFLIVCLAVFDLLSCLIAIPNEIADMRFYYDFQSVGACKIMRFLTTFCAIGSIFTLLVIATDRYRKICKPFGSQMNMKHVRLSLIPIVGMATLFSWPSFILYGLRTTGTEIPGLFGQDCSTPDGMIDTAYPLVYNGILFVCFIIITITLITIYTFVLRETKRHNRYLKRNSDFNIPSSGQYYSEESNSNAEVQPEPTPTVNLENSTSTSAVQVVFGSTATVQTTDEELVAEEKLKELSKFNNTDKKENIAYLNVDSVALIMRTSNGSSNSEATSSHNSKTSLSNVYCTDTSLIMQQSRNQYSLEPSLQQQDDNFENSTYSFLQSSQNDNQHSEETNLQSHQNHNSHSKSPSLSIDKRSNLRRSNENKTKDQRTVLFNETMSSTHQESLKRRRRIKSRTTMIAFSVTLVFILSFLPHLCLQVTKMVHKGFDYHLRGAPLVLYNIFLRSYFINSVSNPIIYGALNLHFRKQVKLLITRLCGNS